MMINPVLVGVVGTILVELIIVVVLTIIGMRKERRK